MPVAATLLLRLAVCMSVFAFTTACTTTDPVARRMAAQQLANEAGWQRTIIATETFDMAVFRPLNPPHTRSLKIYIEGDGLAWLDSSTPSADPTPRDPLALKLALRDPEQNAVYLARPCQFLEEAERRNCQQRYWTNDRFAPAVITASNSAIDVLKKESGATNLTLIGYSGGGAVAALLAAQRNDVTALVTVAGNLDHAAWTAKHRVSPLHGSLNPADASARLQNTPQQHYVGENDRNISVDIARGFAARFAAPRPEITVMPGFTHTCCWEEIWPALVKTHFGLTATAP